MTFSMGRLRILPALILLVSASARVRAGVLPAAAADARWVAAVAHAPGAAGSKWRTDLSVLNLCTGAVTVELRLHLADGISSRIETVEAGQLRLFADVVASLASSDASGSLEIVSSGPVSVRSRTYNASPTGTFGQSLDGVAPDSGLASGATAVLQQLSESSAFRTNIGVVNMGNTNGGASVTLFTSDGAEVGSYTLSIPAGRLVQDLAPYRARFGRTDIEAGFARVRVDSGSNLWMYASVVDNATGDPTTISMEVLPPACGNGVSYSGSFPAGPGEHDTTLTLSGSARNVFVYVPPSAGTQPSLLIALHGTGSGTEVGMGREMAGRFEVMADAHGMVLAGPDATVQPNADWDQHSGGQQYWETRPTSDPGRGSDPDRNPDLLLIRAILQEAKRAYGVDPRRIYVAGFSNGGFFSLTVAVALENRIAAGMEMSAGLVRCDNTNQCVWAGGSTTCAGLRAESDYCSCSGTEKPIAIPTSGRMPPMILTHGNQDWTVSVCYTCELADRMAALGHEAQVTIRNQVDHEIPDFGDPAVYGPVWSFFDGHPLPLPEGRPPSGSSTIQR